MPTFPSIGTPTYDAFSANVPGDHLRTTMEGYIKQYKRYSKTYTTRTLRYIVTSSQLSTFETFWSSDIDRGSTSFTWTDPIDSSALTARLVGGNYKYASAGADNYTLELVIEVLE